MSSTTAVKQTASPLPRQSRDFDVAQTFGIQAPSGLRIPGWSQPGPLTPASQPDYVFRNGFLSDWLGWYRECLNGCPDGLWIMGPTGSGKSSGVVEICARLNLDLFRVNAKKHLEVADLIGHLTVIDGDVLFQDGPLTLCARHGWLLLLDEIDLMEPGELAGLNTVLDGGPLVIAENGGEVVQPAPGFGVICSANTGGNGDSAQFYLGTQRMNGAFLDRFALMQVDYPEPAHERRILAQACPTLPAPLLDNFIAVANEVRALFKGDWEDRDPIEVTLSTRTLVRWARKTVCYQQAPDPIRHALDRALTLRAEPETRAAIFGIVQRIFGDTTCQQVVNQTA